MNPRAFAESTLTLLQQDPRRYLCFGVYWYLVKEVLKRFYTRDNLYMLGDHLDQSVIERMPPFDRIEAALQAAVEEYRQNATFNLGRATVSTPDGDVITLNDPDAALA